MNNEKDELLNQFLRLGNNAKAIMKPLVSMRYLTLGLILPAFMSSENAILSSWS